MTEAYENLPAFFFFLAATARTFSRVRCPGLSEHLLNKSPIPIFHDFFFFIFPLLFQSFFLFVFLTPSYLCLIKQFFFFAMSDAPEIDESILTSHSSENALVGQIKSFAAGGFGGVCSVAVGHPFDLVKVRLQTSTPGTYSGALDVVKKTIAHDGGLRGLYRGVGAPLVGVTPMFAISFWGYDLGQRIVKASDSSYVEGSKLSIGQISAAGFISALPTTAVAAPFERIKVILQLQGQGSSKPAAPGAAAAVPKKQFNGAIDVALHLYKTGGLKSVFKGSVATFARDGPGSALYFATYEYLKRKLTPEDSDQLSLTAISFAGGMAGIAMWVPVFPIDTIKSNLQSGKNSGGLITVTKEIYRTGGIKAFFPGIGPALARSFPANAATFVGVELAYSFFKSLGV